MLWHDFFFTMLRVNLMRIYESANHDMDATLETTTFGVASNNAQRMCQN